MQQHRLADRVLCADAQRGPQPLAELRKPFPPPAGQDTGSGGQGLQGVLRIEHLIQQPAQGLGAVALAGFCGALSEQL